MNDQHRSALPDTDLRVRLELAGVPDSVAFVRSVLETVTRAAALGPELADDMRTAVSEACNNVVLHAYPGSPGPLIFSLTVEGSSIEATVRDHGRGIRPGRAHRSGLGMGVTLINALAERAEFESSEIGTEVRMRFRRPGGLSGSRRTLSPGRSTPTSQSQRSSGGLPAR